MLACVADMSASMNKRLCTMEANTLEVAMNLSVDNIMSDVNNIEACEKYLTTFFSLCKYTITLVNSAHYKVKVNFLIQ